MTSIRTYDLVSAWRNCPSCRRCRSERSGRYPNCSNRPPSCPHRPASRCIPTTLSASSSPAQGQHPGHHRLGGSLRQRYGQPIRQALVRHRHLVHEALRLLRHRPSRIRPHHGRTGQHLTPMPGLPTAIPRPGQSERSPTSRKANQLRHAQRYQRHAFARSTRLAARQHRTAGKLRAVRHTGAEPLPGQGRALTQGLRRKLDHRTRTWLCYLARLIRLHTPATGEPR